MSCGGELTHFPCKLGLKKTFTALGVQVHEEVKQYNLLNGCDVPHAVPTLVTVDTDVKVMGTAVERAR